MVLGNVQFEIISCLDMYWFIWVVNASWILEWRVVL